MISSASRHVDAYYPGPGDRAHPGPAAIGLGAAMRDAIVADLRAALPDEGCGLVLGDRAVGDGGRAVRWVPMQNAAASPYRYELEPDQLLGVMLDAERRGEELWAIVHSHVASPARPSPTDVGESFYPDSLYLLVSFDPAEADTSTGAASVRAWRIVDGTVHEVAIAIEDGR